MIRNVNKVIAILAVLATITMFACSGEPIIGFLKGTRLEPPLLTLSLPNAIAFNLSIAYLASVFFWWLVVYLPEKKRLAIIRGSLRAQYQSFKEEVIQTLLWASTGTHDAELPKQLTDHRKFKAYFNENQKQHWYDALNGLQNSPQRMSELVLNFNMLSDEVTYTLNNANIEDFQVHQFLKRLNEVLYRLKHSDADLYDRVKDAGNFIWGLLARWSFIDGQNEIDSVQEMIERL